MTTTEMAERLQAEFPDRYVSFTIEINSWPYSRLGIGDYSMQPRTEVAITIYAEGVKHIECSDLEGGIKQLKTELGLIQPNIDIAL